MAPAVPRKGNQRVEPAGALEQPMASATLPAEAAAMLRQLAQLQAKRCAIPAGSARTSPSNRAKCIMASAMRNPIHGQATLEQARDLLEEGVPVMPLPFPVAPPEDLN
jgi:hypothetical protein